MNLRVGLMATAAITASMAGSAAFAQPIATLALQAGAPATADATVDEIVVTGSLVVRNGNEAPTPVTVVDAATLQQTAPSNIPDALNQLPQFSGSNSQTSSDQQGTAVRPTSGNYLNLRNLGAQRSLILVDGQRVPPTSYEGIVDTNTLPQMLIQRVDVVTAGASATYGSDALTGVVNFVLDKKFNGVKGVVQGGISDYGDDNSYKLQIAAGTPVLDGRGHLLFSAEHYQSDGIKDKAERPLYSDFSCAYGNGSTVPYRIETNCRQNNANAGGVILSGPLANQTFNPDGSLSPYDRGSLPPLSGMQIGGNGGRAINASLVGYLRTEQLFARGSYDFTDDITGFVQTSFAESRNRYAHNGADNRFGNMTIFSGNAFLSPEQQAALTAAGTASFTMGRQGFEQGRKVVDILNDSLSVMAGLEGKFLTDWTWKLTYAGGGSMMRGKHTRNPTTERYFAAIDAVRNASGQIVCRVTVVAPGRMDDCVPLNMLGANRASKEAVEYAFGADSQYDVRNEMHDVAAVVSGSIYELPAGTVNVAGGVEWRTQSLEMRSNADPAIPLDLTGLRGVPAGVGKFGNTNQGVAVGEQDVSEAFGEILVPLLKDLPLVQSLDLNLAGRVTDYSTSGRVETWKAGLSYAPINDLRVRATLSRDIRAPTLNELFSGVRLSTSAFSDPHTGVTYSLAAETGGNPGLVPEIGKTMALGFVYQPSWLTGFSASVDYYNIEIEGAIATRSNVQIVQDCEDSGGTLPSCDLITRPFPFSDRSPANAVTRIRAVPQNLAVAYTHGIDFDAAYRFPLSNIWEASDATITLRALANYAPSYKTRDTPTAPIRQLAGEAPNAKLRATLSVGYVNGPLSLNLQQRYIGQLNRSQQPSVLFEDNVIEPVRYYNLSAAYKFTVAERDLEAFLNVNNLLNDLPPLAPLNREPGLTYPTLQNVYDVVGRYYTVGLRFKF